MTLQPNRRARRQQEAEKKLVLRVAMHYTKGKTVTEIARALAISEDRVQHALKMARQIVGRAK